MKQILQSLKSGQTVIADIPYPQLASGNLLIRTNQSLISSGTEKMLLDFGKGTWLDKARQQPEKVKMVFDKIKTDGLLPTIDAVRHKLDQLLVMGYCNVGTVIAVGKDVQDFSMNDRVISNGPHAEIVSVSKNLCCKIPASVTNEEAAFTVLGAIALQGIRLAQPTLGEGFVVIGLGLIGLLTVQLLRAHGCRVLAVDIDPERMKLAEQFGAQIVPTDEDVLAVAKQFSRERGVDGVLITAATKSNEPINQAAQMSRKKGRIILIGVAGLELSRADFYQKELTFQVSCSYGPGRYDPAYEEKGFDYPIGFVRWTEQRNFEAFLDMLANKSINVQPLITHQYLIAEAEKAYELLSSDEKKLGILLNYPHHTEIDKSDTDKIPLHPMSFNEINIGVIGAGNYASRILIPAFKKVDVGFKSIACRAGVSGMQVGKKYGFAEVTTNTDSLIADLDINTIIIASRHNDHADFVCQSLSAHKHVYVEKPLCLTLQELDRIVDTVKANPQQLLMVGFNRRFAPHTIKIKELLQSVSEPKTFIMTVNAGEVPADHWVQNREIGGGRIIGEMCHFIDLLRHLANAKIVDFQSTHLKNVAIEDDKVSLSLRFADGSFGVIHYLANGHRGFPKERLEIFVAGKILQLDNFRKLRGYGWQQFKSMKLWRQDKGQLNGVRAFVDAIKQGTSAPVPFEEIVEVSRVTIEVAGGN